MTPLTSRRFRLGAFGVCWLVAAALQVYASDVGTHGALVGAYVPGWLLAIAAIPWWTLLAPAAVDGVAVLAAANLSRGAMRVLTIVNAIGLVAYAFVSLAVIFYVAFANNGIS
ncbi:MAG TPA: hypothetical protein VMD47_12845 [Candidatus Acidoferrales bacterium]|nr:hypothetical protein [Candidatus Acidoferrales bacterium]